MSTTTAPAHLAVSDDRRLPTDILTAVLALSLWVGTGSLLLTLVEGLGDQPGRRLAVGIVLLCCAGVALARRDQVSAILERRPSLVIVVAAVQITGAAIDGVVGGAFVAFSLTSIGLATVVARARTVWLCVLVLEVGYFASLALDGHTLNQLVDDGQLGGVIGATAGYPVAAALFLGLRARFARFLGGIDSTLEAIRSDDHAFTPSLRQLLRGQSLGLPAPAAPGADLTPTERRVVEALAEGIAAKEIAFAWDVKISTIRTHIKHAKAKTGARTLPELASFATRPDWTPSDVAD